MIRAGLAVWLVKAAGLLVPSSERPEWRQEWMVELETLLCLHEEGRGKGYPDPLGFAAGAVRHAWWTRTRGWRMGGVLQDVRYAWRRLRKAPGFTLVAALTLALGVGANGAIFSLVNGLVLRPPSGIEAPDRLVQVARSYDRAPRWDNWSTPALEVMSTEAPALSGVAGYSTREFVVGQGAEAEPLPGQYVTGAYFDVLGIRPVAGRLLQPADDRVPGGHPVVVLGHGLWTRRFGGDPGAVGKTLWIGAQPYEIVGVAPRSFAGPEAVGAPPALWVPSMQHPGFYGELPFQEWGFSWLSVVGRLAEGVTFEQAQASMDLVTARLRDASPVNDGIRVLVASGVGLDPADRAEAERLSLLLLGIVGLVLLLTCMNVANLFLVRTAARTSEMGLRKALGAGRVRLARQWLVEALLLAGIATLVAVPILRLSSRFLPLVVPYTLAISTAPDLRVYTFLALAGCAAGVFFGVVPAWVASRMDVVVALRQGSGTGSAGGARLRSALVVAQLALSLGLVAGAGLLARSVQKARTAEPGFQPRNLTVAFFDLDATGRYDAESGRSSVAAILQEVRGIPGVAAATVANQAPIAGGHSRATVRPAGRSDVDFEAERIIVGPRYFETLGIEVVSGRPLEVAQDEASGGVVINQALAELFWPGQDPVGQALEGGSDRWRVVGVAAEVQMRSLRSRANPAVYHPLSRVYEGRVALHVRAPGAEQGLARAIRSAVARVDPGLPVANVVSLDDALAASMGETRTLGRLVAAFATLALVLAIVGLYGMVSFTVSTRVRELGIRAALGASPGALVRAVISRGIMLTAVGIAGGLLVAFLVGRAFRSLLFGVGETDGVTLLAAVLFLGGTAFIASWLPARRAGQVDAAVSLREGTGA